jgi:hypothetical protein
MIRTIIFIISLGCIVNNCIEIGASFGRCEPIIQQNHALGEKLNYL